jgi:tRNA threonylcarbamoyladenosine biosynthesis protein TsaB
VAPVSGEARIDLGIDTASDDVALALLDGEMTLAEHGWAVQTTIAAELLERLHVLLGEAGVARDAISTIAVDVGPGGYGGLRAGVAVAQGLALALDVPLAAVGRLEVDAYPHLHSAPAGTPVVAVHEAGRGRIAWAAFALDAPGAAPRTVVEPRIDDPGTAAEEAPAGATWCGEISPALRAPLEGRGSVRFAEQRGRSAVDVVRLARLHDAHGDPALVDVVYLRPPPITKPRER